MLLRKANERGLSEMDWLKSYHTFSFANYYDPRFMGFGSLRVINEDSVQPGMGFGSHSHQNMEIISYVVAGALEHKDSMGTGSIIRPGEIQKMSAGTGVSHSEFNSSQKDPVHFLQIWILPEKNGLTPSYEQVKIIRNLHDKLILIGSSQKQENVITIAQNVQLYVGYLSKEDTINYPFKGKQCWIQVVRGKIAVNEQALDAGDGLGLNEISAVKITSMETAEFLLFDLG